MGIVHFKIQYLYIFYHLFISVNITPDVNFFYVLLQYFHRADDNTNFELWLTKLKMYNTRLNKDLYYLLIDYYTKLENLEETLKYLHEMKERSIYVDIIHYNAILSLLSKKVKQSLL